MSYNDFKNDVMKKMEEKKCEENHYTVLHDNILQEYKNKTQAIIESIQHKFNDNCEVLDKKYEEYNNIRKQNAKRKIELEDNLKYIENVKNEIKDILGGINEEDTRCGNMMEKINEMRENDKGHNKRMKIEIESDLKLQIDKIKNTIEEDMKNKMHGIDIELVQKYEKKERELKKDIRKQDVLLKHYEKKNDIIKNMMCELDNVENEKKTNKSSKKKE